MKKTFFCLASVIICLFLILPFLDKTSSSVVQSAEKEKESAIPQIFTSNPLTNLAKKIINFLKREKLPAVKRKSLAEEMIAELPLEERLGKNAPLIASANRNDINYLSSQASAISGAQSYPEEANQVIPTPLMDEDEDWIFIRQHSPKGIVAGMHEINARDNSHNTSLKQQNTRFLPMAGKQTQAASASHLSHMLKPMQNSFGLNGVPLAKEMTYSGNSSSSPVSSITSSSLSRKKRGMDKSGNKKQTLLARFHNIGESLNNFKSLRQSSVNRDTDEDAPSAAQEFWADYLDPNTIAKNVGKESADISHPTPSSKKEQTAKEKAEQDATQSAKDFLYQQYTNVINASFPLNAHNFKKIFRDCQSRPSALNHSRDTCNLNSPTDYRAIKQENEAEIRRALQIPEDESMPDLPLSIIYGQAHMLSDTVIFDDFSRLEGKPIPTYMDQIEQLTDNNTPANDKKDAATTLGRILELKQYQAQVEQCKECYWVASNEATDLFARFKAAGPIQPIGDPKQRGSVAKARFKQTIMAEFETKLESLDWDDRRKEAARKQFEAAVDNSHTMYDAYPQSDLLEIPHKYYQDPFDAASALAEQEKNIGQTGPSYILFNMEALRNQGQDSEQLPNNQNTGWDADVSLEEGARAIKEDILTAIEIGKQAQDIQTGKAVEGRMNEMYINNKDQVKMIQDEVHALNQTASPTGGRH